MYRRRLDHKVSYFRRLPCFGVFSDVQLRKLVEMRPLEVRKREEVLFSEGEASGERLWLLAEGECRAEKTLELFKEDPNKLYEGQKGEDVTNGESLPWADLEGVFNYSPRRKECTCGCMRG